MRVEEVPVRRMCEECAKDVTTRYVIIVPFMYVCVCVYVRTLGPLLMHLLSTTFFQSFHPHFRSIYLIKYTISYLLMVYCSFILKILINI